MWFDKHPRTTLPLNDHPAKIINKMTTGRRTLERMITNTWVKPTQSCSRLFPVFLRSLGWNEVRVAPEGDTASRRGIFTDEHIYILYKLWGIVINLAKKLSFGIKVQLFLSHLLLHVCFPLLSLQGFSHTKRNTRGTWKQLHVKNCFLLSRCIKMSKIK